MMVADEMPAAAVVALSDRVVLGEATPVPLLLRGQDARASAQRACVIERSQDRRADERGAVGYPTHRLKERVVGFEGYDGLLAIRHGRVSICYISGYASHRLPRRCSGQIMTLCYLVSTKPIGEWRPDSSTYPADNG